MATPAVTKAGKYRKCSKESFPTKNQAPVVKKRDSSYVVRNSIRHIIFLREFALAVCMI